MFSLDRESLQALNALQAANYNADVAAGLLIEGGLEEQLPGDEGAGVAPGLFGAVGGAEPEGGSRFSISCFVSFS